MKTALKGKVEREGEEGGGRRKRTRVLLVLHFPTNLPATLATWKQGTEREVRKRGAGEREISAKPCGRLFLTNLA